MNMCSFLLFFGCLLEKEEQGKYNSLHPVNEYILIIANRFD